MLKRLDEILKIDRSGTWEISTILKVHYSILYVQKLFGQIKGTTNRLALFDTSSWKSTQIHELHLTTLAYLSFSSFV